MHTDTIPLHSRTCIHQPIIQIYKIVLSKFKTMSFPLFKVLITKTEINNEWNVHFLQNCPLKIQNSEFSIVRSTFETALLIYWGAAPSYLLIYPTSSNFIVEIIFKFQKQVTQSYVKWVWRMVHLYNLVFHQKHFVEKVSRLLIKKYLELALTRQMSRFLHIIFLLYKLLRYARLHLNFKFYS